ncbi:MAG TPA: hypothetical protein VMD59_05655 [Acidimicrobiales bacterium]|nr:hypothetical protein [Acidimicrobiales bacterium]
MLIAVGTGSPPEEITRATADPPTWSPAVAGSVGGGGAPDPGLAGAVIPPAP